MLALTTLRNILSDSAPNIDIRISLTRLKKNTLLAENINVIFDKNLLRNDTTIVTNIQSYK